MSNENDTKALETLSDEDFLKLTPEEAMAQVNVEGGQEEEDVQDDETPEETEDDDEDAAPGEPSDDDDGDEDPASEETDDGSEDDDEKSEEAPDEATEDDASENPEEEVPATDTKPSDEEPKPKKAAPGDKAEKPGKSEEKKASADEVQAFYDKITAPFKSDGRTMKVRDAEDAIRLMQMGTNYHRRMQELRPLRAMNKMLTEHGLDKPERLGLLIDASKGDAGAIKKLLAEHKIDPLDIDTSEETPYTASDYTPDQVTAQFEETVDDVVKQDGGLPLIQSINADWDDASKESLRENPTHLKVLLDQQRSGVYKQIQDEIAYRKTLGDLDGVPYLQAYVTVGKEMETAGVFGEATTSTKKASTQPAKQPIDTGHRKVRTKRPAPNPSSTSHPRSTAKIEPEEAVDYSQLTDEQISKLPVPE